MKPPVVVVERHCKTNQCWIAVRFKKIPSVAKISQSFEASAREEVRANEFHTGIAGECLFSSCVRAPSSKVLRLALAVCLALVTVETVFRAAKKAARRASRRAAGRSFRLADGSATEPAAARALLALTSHRRINSVRDRVTNCLHSFALMRASATTPPSRLLRALL